MHADYAYFRCAILLNAMAAKKPSFYTWRIFVSNISWPFCTSVKALSLADVIASRASHIVELASFIDSAGRAGLGTSRAAACVADAPTYSSHQ